MLIVGAGSDRVAPTAPSPHETATWSSNGPAGSFSSASWMTRRNGVASVHVTTGLSSGASHTIAATDDQGTAGSGTLRNTSRSQTSPSAACRSSVGPGIPPPVSVPAGIPGFHAAWYGQSGYPTLCPGERSTATVAYYNSGSLGWVAGRMGEAAYLGTWDPDPGQDTPSKLGGDGTNGSPSTGWPRFNRIAAQPASYVGPGQVAWFQFTIQAPLTPGTYYLYLRPLIEGSQWMEDFGVFWRVTVPAPTGTWLQRGPAPLFGQLGFGDASYVQTGRANQVGLANASTWYVATPHGGLWKTTTAGASWSQVGDGDLASFVSVVVDPANSMVVWAGTGDIGLVDAASLVGVLKSQDAGLTWARHGTSVFSGVTLSKLALDPTSPVNARVLYAGAHFLPSTATTTGLATSVDGGETWTNVRDQSGIFQDWSASSLSTASPVSDVAVTAGGVVFAAVAGVWNVPTTKAGIYRSDDRGKTFTRLTSGLPGDPSSIGRIALAVTPADPRVIYAAIAPSHGDALLGLYRSADGGSTWSRTTYRDRSPRFQWGADMALAVSPRDPNAVFLGGIDLQRSTDGGDTWTAVDPGHVDQQYVQFLAADSQQIVVANDGGVYVSRDGGDSWQDAIGRGEGALVLGQAIAGAIHPTDPTVIWAGFNDSGIAGTTGNQSWTLTRGGDGRQVEIDFANPQTMYALIWPPYDIVRSDNGGRSWQSRTNGIQDVGGSVTYCGCGFVMDPTNPSVLYAISGGSLSGRTLYRTADRGETWQPFFSSAAPRGLGAIALSKSDPRTVYTGDGFGSVWVTRDGGATWTGPLGSGNGLTTGGLSSLAVDPNDPAIAYAAFGALQPNGAPTVGSVRVFRTSDGGTTWTSAAGSLLVENAYTISVDPLNSNVLYVGTELGVYRSKDRGTNWERLSTGMPRVSVSQLRFSRSGDAVYAFTVGRGVYVMYLGFLDH